MNNDAQPNNASSDELKWRRVRTASGWMATLAFVATVALPVFGMMRAFSELEKQREVEASRLAEGIMFALMLGAIPLVIASVAIVVWVLAQKKSQPHAKDN